MQSLLVFPIPFGAPERAGVDRGLRWGRIDRRSEEKGVDHARSGAVVRRSSDEESAAELLAMARNR
ncbi:hypothetical protein [Sphingomonas sp.]|uniref:hypothetical protein n=1 Tax=Sphingomonas sp. TaxID=28214 RepID=UPI002FDA28FF